MIVVNNETLEFQLFKHKENSDFEYEESPIYFRGRVATSFEIKNYRLQKGVVSNQDSIYIISSNLPKEIEPTDKIVWLNKDSMVESCGYFFNQTQIVNLSKMSANYIMSKCPKGITIK